MPADLERIHRERERLLRVHEKVLSRAVDVVRHGTRDPGKIATQISQSVLDELEHAREQLARQAKRLVELKRIAEDYEELKLQYRVLEQTNQRLMRQLLAIDDDLAERAELQQIIDMQKDALEKSARRLHEMEQQNRMHLHNIEVLEKENELARERVHHLQEQIQSLLQVQEQQKREISRLRAQARQKEVAALQANEAYEALKAEYEAMYVNSPLARGSV
ncbi:hypothetical protein [endosymbiont of unidentified scaly snail isolate Monju]|uniref:hypothetical protein n=1 Tax=endosymbiont of unidentified scaly snail isolate Monju TaxID=1248727 RepID=UPI0003891AE5|nr:hypothetical protein [endosymbiont of unidentified scaly snail isolate Monju]BAN69732.1 hypothetical protein EBS_1863 [endosymbiont of unidentified scaly snail isolate Monju]